MMLINCEKVNIYVRLLISCFITRLSPSSQKPETPVRCSSASFPRSSPFSRLPRFSFTNFSVPSTPADTSSWEKESTDKTFLRKREFTSSSSSVEDGHVSESFKKKTRSRLSLNLSLFDESPIKSPKLLPKFRFGNPINP